MSTINLVKELRKISGAAFIDCKKALEETDGNLEASIDWLRKRGIELSKKKQAREANEGAIAVHQMDDNSGVSMVHLSSETDFVAKNEQFQDFILKCAKLNKSNSVDDLLEAAIDGGVKVKDKINEVIAVIGENMNVKRCAFLQGPHTYHYIHNKYTDHIGKAAAAVSLTGDNADKIAKDLLFHIVAFPSIALDEDSVDPATKEREKKIIEDMDDISSKPSAVRAGIVAGRMKKFYKKNTLLEQQWVKDSSKTVSDVLKENDVKIVSYAYMNIAS